MYHEELLDHFKYPQNKVSIKNPHFTAGKHNPSCGDSIRMEGTLENDKLATIGFTGSGCIISQATASMLTEYCKGKSIQEIMAFSPATITAILGMPLGPVRMKCALLPLDVLQEGITQAHQ